MAQQQRDMSGILFKNDKREKGSHPHATGHATIEGVEYWVSAWTKEGQNGKFQSLSFKRKDQGGQKPKNAPRVEDDDTPF